MVLSLSVEDARRFLVRYHFSPTDILGVLSRLATVQYDPLNPMGRNPDLVFQARVPGYHVDDWQTAAYMDRLMYDSWDKQACLVPVADWPFRALVRSKYQPWHDRDVFLDHADAVAATLEEIDQRGALCSLDFMDRSRMEGGHAWLGAIRVKRILRALWARGDIVTHHRQAGRHYFDRSERVIPATHFHASPLLDEPGYQRWIVERRHQAVGLLRPNAEAVIWSACGDGVGRKRAIEALVDEGRLIPVLVGKRRTLYHMLASATRFLEEKEFQRRVIFLAPLDSLLWDRTAVREIFDFHYVWEVYKPESKRAWGYYVLPVLYGDCFVARVDARLAGDTWTITRWWWEDGFGPEGDLGEALRDAVVHFLRYLRAARVRIPDRSIDRSTRAILHAKTSG